MVGSTTSHPSRLRFPRALGREAVEGGSQSRVIALSTSPGLRRDMTVVSRRIAMPHARRLLIGIPRLGPRLDGHRRAGAEGSTSPRSTDRLPHHQQMLPRPLRPPACIQTAYGKLADRPQLDLDPDPTALGPVLLAVPCLQTQFP